MTATNPSEPVAATSEPGAARAYRHFPSILVFVVVSAAILAGDLGIKTWAFAHVAGEPVTLPAPAGIDPNLIIPPHKPWHVIHHVLDLQLTANRGAVFGLGKGMQLFFIVVSVAAVGVIVTSFARSRAGAFALHVALAMILAGAIGNLYDRASFNCVRDMFRIFPDWGVWPWIFNLADASLMVGMGILIVTLWLHDRRQQTAAADPG
jgi:signal peptidase II